MVEIRVDGSDAVAAGGEGTEQHLCNGGLSCTPLAGGHRDDAHASSIQAGVAYEDSNIPQQQAMSIALYVHRNLARGQEAKAASLGANLVPRAAAHRMGFNRPDAGQSQAQPAAALMGRAKRQPRRRGPRQPPQRVRIVGRVSKIG